MDAVISSEKDGQLLLRAGQDELLIWMPKPNVFCTVARNNLRHALAIRLIDWMDATLLESRPVHVFHDWTEMTRYDTESRVKLTHYAERRIRCFASTNILIRSRLLAMGITVANILLRNHIQVYSQRDRFEKLMKRTMSVPHYERVA